MNVSDVTEIHFILKQMLMSVCQAHLPAMHKRTVSMISDPTTAPVKLAMLVTENTSAQVCQVFKVQVLLFALSWNAAIWEQRGLFTIITK